MSNSLLELVFDKILEHAFSECPDFQRVRFYSNRLPHDLVSYKIVRCDCGWVFCFSDLELKFIRGESTVTEKHFLESIENGTQVLLRRDIEERINGYKEERNRKMQIIEAERIEKQRVVFMSRARVRSAVSWLEVV